MTFDEVVDSNETDVRDPATVLRVGSERSKESNNEGKGWCMTCTAARRRRHQVFDLHSPAPSSTCSTPRQSEYIGTWYASSGNAIHRVSFIERSIESDGEQHSSSARLRDSKSVSSDKTVGRTSERSARIKGCRCNAVVADLVEHILAGELVRNVMVGVLERALMSASKALVDSGESGLTAVAYRELFMILSRKMVSQEVDEAWAVMSCCLLDGGWPEMFCKWAMASTYISAPLQSPFSRCLKSHRGLTLRPSRDDRILRPQQASSLRRQAVVSAVAAAAASDSLTSDEPRAALHGAEIVPLDFRR
nr:hypothetical protein CFP56_60248 [Quercus suber]